MDFDASVQPRNIFGSFPSTSKGSLASHPISNQKRQQLKPSLFSTTHPEIPIWQHLLLEEICSTKKYGYWKNSHLLKMPKPMTSEAKENKRPKTSLLSPKFLFDKTNGNWSSCYSNSSNMNRIVAKVEVEEYLKHLPVNIEIGNTPNFQCQPTNIKERSSKTIVPREKNYKSKLTEPICNENNINTLPHLFFKTTNTSNIVRNLGHPANIVPSRFFTSTSRHAASSSFYNFYRGTFLPGFANLEENFNSDSNPKAGATSKLMCGPGREGKTHKNKMLVGSVEDTMSNAYKDLETRVVKDQKLTQHQSAKAHSCRTCRRKFTRMSNLRRHIISTHKKFKPFKCLSCSRTFARKANKTRHEQLHRKRINS